MREKYESEGSGKSERAEGGFHPEKAGIDRAYAGRGSEGIPVGKHRREEYRREGVGGQEACTRNADREKSGIKEYPGEGAG